MDKYVLLDFCETVVDFQTFDAFLEYVLQSKRPWLYKLCMCKSLVFVLNKMTALLMRIGYKLYLRKHLLIACTLGMNINALLSCGEDFYKKIVSRHYIRDTIRLIKKFQQDNLKIIVISGGSKFYIDCFAQEYGIKHVISAEFLTLNNKSMGILRRECLGTEKMIMLDDYLMKHNLSGEFEYAVTDSKSDMPMIKRAKQAIIISHKNHKSWVNETMEEIIWD